MSPLECYLVNLLVVLRNLAIACKYGTYNHKKYNVKY
jgi:hypothetical protein